VVRKFLAMISILSVLLLVIASIAVADPTGNNGKPDQSCQNPATSTTPGNAGNPSNTGSPFSPNGHSGTVYNPGSQYDVACFQNSQPHP
jgi:hypothetical protein